jgi:peptidoglycan/xylan/chitin deacetylase (PgdA/CDA1 family)
MFHPFAKLEAFRRARTAAPVTRFSCCRLALAAVGLWLASLPATLPAAEPVGIAVLVYHRVSSEGGKGDAETIPLDRFRAQMAYLAAKGYSTISVQDLVEVLEGIRNAPPKAVVITFDDAWASAQPALDVIRERGFKASLFIPSGVLVEGENMRWSDLQGLGTFPNFEFGSHSLTHPCRPSLVDWVENRVPGKGIPEVKLELTQSRNDIEQKLGRPVRYFAWPCGIFNNHLIGLAKEAGYEGLLTAWEGKNFPGGDPFVIHRLNVDGSCPITDFEQGLLAGKHITCNGPQKQHE